MNIGSSNKERVRIPVLYIAGACRSGSTMLELILGNLPGYSSAGEVRYFWEHQAEGGWRCGCGRPLDGHLLDACPFWSLVIARLPAGKMDQLGNEARRFDRTRNLPFIAAPVGNGRKPPLSLIEGTAQLYRAIWEVSGRQVIVDSSKVPSHLYILQQIPDIDLRVLHLVRDARAVAYSWRNRQKQDLGKMQPDAPMPVYPTLKSLLVWDLENAYAASFGRRATHYAVMRYEDFVHQPTNVLQQTLSKLALDGSALPLHNGAFTGSPTHSVGGNPLRFGRTEIQIKLDNEWQESLPRSARLLQGLVAYPMLRRFGYAIL
jgi:hypothetical protein